MTEEFWRSYMKNEKIKNSNVMFNRMKESLHQEVIMNKHPDELYGICRADNNYWRHYRASTKLSVDELAMMICKDPGWDLQYCQMQMWKPKLGSKQKFRDWKDEYYDFRDCFIREKRIFKSMVPEDEQKDENAIPNYLEKVFKQKEEDKMKRKMMGDDDDLRHKIKSYEDTGASKKVIDVNQFEQQKKQMEEKYM